MCSNVGRSEPSRAQMPTENLIVPASNQLYSFALNHKYLLAAHGL